MKTAIWWSGRGVACAAILAAGAAFGVGVASAADAEAAREPVASVASAAAAQDGKTYEELLVDLADDDGRKRRVAVRRLAELGTEQAWQRVVERLADTDAQVADEAQIRLAELGDEKVWREHVFGRSGLAGKDQLVRRRVVEALGRAPAAPFDAALALDLLKDGDDEVRRLAAFSLERLAATGGPAALDAAAREKVVDELTKRMRTDAVGEVVGAALLAAQALAPQRFEVGGDVRAAGEKLLAHKLSAARVAALIALGRAGGDAAVALVQGLARDESIAVRIEVVRALENVRSKSGVLALVALLEDEKATSLAIRIAEALQRLSGLKHRTDPRPWRDWAATLADDWKPNDGGAVVEEITVTKLVGLSLRSERLALLIDMSGSMWQSRPDGRKTKDLVDVELRRCLEGLPESARFNLLPYATEPQRYEEDLVEASPKKVAKALEWFEENTLRGKGNVWDAVELALQDPELDTLVIMTDGAPTGGPHWNLELMVPLLVERTRFRNVVFDVLLSDAPDNLVPHWQRLAAATGGRCAEVEFEE
jgi:HEAT repeat protein